MSAKQGGTKGLRGAVAVAIAAAAVLGCGGGDPNNGLGPGLHCNSGEFYYDGKKFTDCGVCPSADCGFEEQAHDTCTYPNGVQVCTVTSGTVTAHCAGETAKIVITDGKAQCSG